MVNSQANVDDVSMYLKFGHESITLSKIVLTLPVKLPCPKCKMLIVREIVVLSLIVSEKNRKKDLKLKGLS
jgi:hypothetical protein